MNTDPERDFDPAPSECWPHKPREDADIHEGATHLDTTRVGETVNEHWRCADCGREWTV